MELRWPHIVRLYHAFLENDGKENCAQLIEEEFNKMFGIETFHYVHNCNVVSMNSLNIHDANDVQSHKLGDVMFDEDDIFCPPSKFIMMIACLLFMMIILMKVDLERS